MLSYMRENAGSWMIKVILGLIVVVFVFWGVGSFRDEQATVVASVDEKPIYYQEYSEAFTNMIEQLGQQFGNRLDDEMIKMLNVRQQALDRVIDKHVLKAEAGRLNMRVSDAELTAAILAVPVFQNNGVFDTNRYQRVLSNLRLTPEGFEQQQRDAMLIERLRGFVTGNVKVSEVEIRQWYDWDKAMVRIGYMLLEPARYDDIDPSDAEVTQFFDENKENYKTESQIKIQFLHLNPENLRGQIKIAEDDVSGYYEANPEAFQIPKTVEARHILFKLDQDAAKDQVEAAKQRALEVLALAREGEDFGELAKTHSEGPSAPSGGFLGAFKREDMVAPFADQAFAMQAGEISEPVRTRFGWHIIKLEKINPASIRSLAEASAEIRDKLTTDRATELAYDTAEEIYDEAFDGDDLAQIADTRGLEIQKTGFFGKQGPAEGIADPTRFANAAFELVDNEISEAQDLGDGYYLLQRIDTQEPRIPDLAEVRAQVVQDLIKEKRDQAAKAEAEAILSELKSGGQWSAVADSHGITAGETEAFTRNQLPPEIGFEREISQAAFGASQDAPLIDRVLQGQKGYFVIRLVERIAADPNGFDAEKIQIEQRLQQQKQSRVFSAYLADLKDKSQIDINTELFN